MSKKNISHAERVEIVERHLAGESLSDIAGEMRVNYYTVRKWWRRWCQGSWAALAPKPPGPQRQGALCRHDPLVKYVALRLKREHSGWGPDLILLHMGRRPSLRGKRIPARSSLAAYLQPFLPRLAPHRDLPTHRPSPLWLVGLDVLPVINRPKRPTDNAQVERMNRTWLDHVGRDAQVDSHAELEFQSEEAWHDRRHYLPSRNRHCKGRPPAVAFPELVHTGRPYHPAQEATLFSISRVYRYLAEWEWQRKVDKSGYISMADYNRFVSKQHRGQIVKVRFDADQAHFVARDVAAIELASFTLPVIDADYIMGTGSQLLDNPRGLP